MALLDILRKKGKKATPQTDVGALERQLVAGQTGRAQQATGPAASGIGTQLAAQQTAAQQEALSGQQLQAGEELAAKQMAAEEQQSLTQRGIEQGREQVLGEMSAQRVMAAAQRQAQEDAQAAELEAKSSEFSENITNIYSEALKDLASARRIAEQDMFSAFEREQKTLSADKAAARLHQLGHIMALSDRQYVDTITNIARERNLRDEINFKIEAYELAMGKDLEFMQSRMDFQATLNKDAREFRKEMFKMDMDTAVELAKIAQKEQNYIQAIQGVTTLAKSGVSAYLSGTEPERAGQFSTGKEVAAQQSLANRYGSAEDPFGSDSYMTHNTPRDYSSFDTWINYGDKK